MFSYGEWKYVSNFQKPYPSTWTATDSTLLRGLQYACTDLSLRNPKIIIVYCIYTRHSNSPVSTLVNIFLSKRPSPYSRIFKPIVWELLSVSMCTTVSMCTATVSVCTATVSMFTETVSVCTATVSMCTATVSVCTATVSMCRATVCVYSNCQCVYSNCQCVYSNCQYVYTAVSVFRATVSMCTATVSMCTVTHHNPHFSLCLSSHVFFRGF